MSFAEIFLRCLVQSVGQILRAAGYGVLLVVGWLVLFGMPLILGVNGFRLVAGVWLAIEIVAGVMIVGHGKELKEAWKKRN